VRTASMREAVAAMRSFRAIDGLRPVGVAVTLWLVCAAGAAQDFDPGRALYENHCASCHADWVHTRESRKVTTVDELRARVAGWSVHAGLQWTTDEVDEVTRYINRRFYQFTE
jgi:mono/diheme cytochrome c family protein